MTQHVLAQSHEILGIAAAALVLLVFSLVMAYPHRPREAAGSRGHREEADEAAHEQVRPDNYIDSFAKEIEEAGGGLPLIVRIAVPAVLGWWLLYLILNWSPH
jgi:hypothetical protein